MFVTKKIDALAWIYHLVNVGFDDNSQLWCHWIPFWKCFHSNYLVPYTMGKIRLEKRAGYIYIFFSKFWCYISNVIPFIQNWQNFGFFGITNEESCSLISSRFMTALEFFQNKNCLGSWVVLNLTFLSLKKLFADRLLNDKLSNTWNKSHKIIRD